MDTRFVLYSRKKNQCVVVLLVKKGLQSGYCKIPYICPYASLAFTISCCSFFSPNFKHEILFQNKKSPRRVWTWTKTIKFISNIILNIFLDGKLSTIIYLRFNFITLELQRSPFSIWSESGAKLNCVVFATVGVFIFCRDIAYYQWSTKTFTAGKINRSWLPNKRGCILNMRLCEMIFPVAQN